MHLSSHRNTVRCGCFLRPGCRQHFYEPPEGREHSPALPLQAAAPEKGCVSLQPRAAITQLLSLLWASPVPNLNPLRLNLGLSPQQKREDPPTA